VRLPGAGGISTPSLERRRAIVNERSRLASSSSRQAAVLLDRRAIDALDIRQIRQFEGANLTQLDASHLVMSGRAWRSPACDPVSVRLFGRRDLHAAKPVR
jgi:hypothetical protein